MKSTRKATTAIILEERKPLKDGRFPVKLRVTYKRIRKYYTLKDLKNNSLAMTRNEFTRVMGSRPRDKYKVNALHLAALEKKGIDIIDKLPLFTFEAFERKYFSISTDEADLFSALKTTTNDLRKEGRISTAVTYDCTLNSLKEYTGKEAMLFENVDSPFLNEYEKWMIGQENSLTTVGIYLRNVRTSFNKAIRDNIIQSSIYPFGHGKYEIPTGKNIKKALTLKEVGQIANYAAVKGSNEHRYRDYWLFSYLCNGINVKDIARLKYSNIDGDVITINRAKTEKERKQSPKPITIVITKMISRIINTWGNKPRLPDQYIFPILKSGLTPLQEYKIIRQATKMINEHIGIIVGELKISQKVTSYTARHSFATVLKRSGASIEFISESLGHSNLKTTENYLSDFEIDVKRKWAEKLGKFK